MTCSLRTHYFLVSEMSGDFAAVGSLSLLNRRARHRSVRTENATVTRFRPKDRMTGLTLVKPLTGIGGHGFDFRVPAFGAGQPRREEYLGQGLAPVTLEGKPASFVALVRASNETWASS